MSSAPGYVERLSVPLRWWAVATMFWASVLLAFLVALPTGVAFGAAAFLSGLNTAVFLTYGSATVSVGDGVLRAGRAQIPVHFLTSPEALDSERTRLVAGVEADARAFLLLRPYVTRAVRVQVTDPADPTPYWLVSSRHPRSLAAELDAAIARFRQRP